MVVTESGITTEVSPVPLKALTPIEVTVLVMVTEFKLLKPAKAASPMDGLPMVTEFKLLKPAKVPPLMEITESGITTEVNPVLEKAPAPMEVTELPIVTDVRLV